MATIRIPTPLRTYTKGLDQVVISGATVGEILTNLNEQYNGITTRVLDKTGKIHRFINLFVNKSDVRRGDGLETAVSDDDVISIFPAIAGGV